MFIRPIQVAIVRAKITEGTTVTQIKNQQIIVIEHRVVLFALHIGAAQLGQVAGKSVGHVDRR